MGSGKRNIFKQTFPNESSMISRKGPKLHTLKMKFSHSLSTCYNFFSESVLSESVRSLF